MARGRRSRGPFCRRHGEQEPPVPRGVRDVRSPVEYGTQAVADAGVVVEAEHGVGLGQFGGKVGAVPLGQTAHRDDRPDVAARPQVGGLQQRIDGVLLGLLDEAAGIDDHRLRHRRVIDQLEALGVQTSGELFRVDLVAGAPRV